MNTIIEKIRAEIERRKKGNQKDASEYGDGAFYEDVAILSILSDLEKECEKPSEVGGLVTLEYSNRCFLNGVEKGRNDMVQADDEGGGGRRGGNNEQVHISPLSIKVRHIPLFLRDRRWIPKR